MQYTVIDKSPISAQTASAVREMIVAGELVAGDRINEVHLSEALGVSRTPLREGLRQLVAEDFVDSEPRRGFFVRPFSVDEFSDLYDLRPILDPAALLAGGAMTVEQVHHLSELNDQFINADTGLNAVMADEAFHRALIARCQNQILTQTIDNLMLRTRRYEIALFRDRQPIRGAADQHILIIDALRHKDVALAAEHLRANLTGGKAPILEWLASRA
ncbi:MAG: GntR family transcriptional regulator [Pseudomonadota bacterium]